MLRNALPAEKPAAPGAACYRFPLHMIAASLLSDIRHWNIKIAPVFFAKSLAQKLAIRLTV